MSNIDFSQKRSIEEIPDQQSSIEGARDELKKVVGVNDGRRESRRLSTTGPSRWQNQFRHDEPSGYRKNLDAYPCEAEEVADDGL